MKSKKTDLHFYLERGKVTIYYLTAIFGLLGYIFDLIAFFDTSKVVIYENSITIIVTLFALTVYFVEKSNFKVSYGIITYTGIANVFIGALVDPFSDISIHFFLRDSLFIMVALTLTSLIVNKKHALIIGFIYLAFALSFALLTNNAFLLMSLYIIFLFVSAFSIIVFYTVSILEKSITDLMEKNQIISDQNELVGEINTLLEERQQQIEEQSEKLKRQTEELETKTKQLTVKNVELDELIQMKDKFLSILAHDLKNPLNILMGFSNILKVKYDRLTDEKKKYYINAMKNTSENTYNLLENLLQWTLSQSRKIEFKPEIIALDKLIDANVNLFSEACKNKQIMLNKSLHPYCSVYADVNMLNTVLRNLIMNAIKFTYPGGKVSVNCNKENGAVNVAVSDDGIGMDQEKIGNLFRIDKTESNIGTAGESGTGLGLLLCKDFIEKNHGIIEVRSKLGKGSIFSFSLPFRQ